MGETPAPSAPSAGTPPEDGHYKFTSRSLTNGFQTAIYLEDGPLCGGPELACNAKDDGYAMRPSEVWRSLKADSPVTIIVDGETGQGDFEIQVANGFDACPVMDIEDQDFFDQFPLSINLSSLSNSMTNTCGENYATEFGLFEYDHNDLLIQVTALEPDAQGNCFWDIAAGFPLAVSFIEGVCEGREVSCEVDDTPSGGEYSVTIPMPKDGQTYTLAVQPAFGPFMTDSWFDDEIKFIGIGCVL